MDLFYKNIIHKSHEMKVNIYKTKYKNKVWENNSLRNIFQRAVKSSNFITVFCYKML